ncbi:hypothetical protein LWT82_24490, partial [Enterobacter ludwigii]|nr:hypothetical protein [Enterobacter ludwigii]MCE1626850.1 hypothetical protein [Enterobacter ludwigii]
MQTLNLQLHTLRARLSAARSTTGLTASALWLAALVAPQALAAQTAVEAEPASSAAPQWQFTVAPYLWGAGIRGNVGHKTTGTQFVKSDFHDIARDLDVAAMT